MLSELVKEELIFTDVDVSNIEELFEYMSLKLMSEGYVNLGYLRGLTVREAKYPTGLITANGNIGIPHADPEYIEEPFVAVVRLKHPIQMKQMGDNQLMESNVFYFLGIQDGKNQVGLLSELMALYMDSHLIEELNSKNTVTNIYKFFVEGE